MIGCTEPGLTEALYIVYIHKTRVTCKMQKKKTWQWTNTANSDWQETDPTSRQRGRLTETKQQLSDRINTWSQVPHWARHQDVLTSYVVMWFWLRLITGIFRLFRFSHCMRCLFLQYLSMKNITLYNYIFICYRTIHQISGDIRCLILQDVLSETLVFRYETTHHDSEDRIGNLHGYYRKSLKSQRGTRT
jgi:hypothetical protein